MAELIAIVGPPGRGKSTAVFPNEVLKIKGLNPKETVIINVSNKSLAMRGWRKHFPDTPIMKGGNYASTHDAELIAKVLHHIDDSRPDIKNIVIEDAQYLMAFAVMERAKQKGYDKWNEIGHIGYRPIEAARDLKREDLFVWFIYHDEKGDDGEMKIKTAGRLIDNTITLEGLFNTILFAGTKTDPMSKKPTYYFVTNADGVVRARSKYGTFESLEIPNDLGLVRDAVEKYNKGE